MPDIFTLKNNATLANIAKPVIPLKIKTLSESIFNNGNFIPKLTQATGAAVTQAQYSSSHIGLALAEASDKVFVPSVVENAVKNSNLLTAASWASSFSTITQEKLSDGLMWNKIVKSDTSLVGGIKTDDASTGLATCPADARGLYVSFDLYVPANSALKDILVQVSNRTNNPVANFLQTPVSSFVDGKKYRVIIAWDKTAITWAMNGTDVYRLVIALNYTDSAHAPSTAYIRNVEVSWDSILYEKYTQTTTTVKAKEALKWVEMDKNSYEDDYDTIIICYGRNDAEDGVQSTSYKNAYDKLISNCIQKTGHLIITNPPPTSNTSTNQLDTDNYVSNGLLTAFKELAVKWNSGIDFNTILREYITSGKYQVTDLMADAFHQSLTGSDLMIAEIMKQYQQRKLLNTAKPKLSGNVNYYLSGKPTGTWKIVNFAGGVEGRLLNNFNSYCLESSTQNDWLLFDGITEAFNQLWLICRIGTGFGAVNVIIDEGLSTEYTVAYNLALSATERQHGHFIVEFPDKAARTVKVKISSTALPVRINGIVTI